MAGDGEGEGDGSVGAHGPGDDQARGLVVELGEPVALVAPLLGAEGVGEPFADGHADDQAAVEAVCPGAKVPCGAEAGAEAGIVLPQYPEVRVRLVPVADGAGAVGGEGGVGGGAGHEGKAEGRVARAVGEWGGGVGGGELEIGGETGRGDVGGCAGDTRLHVDGAEGACEVPGEWLVGLPLVEAVADGLVGDARGAGFELEEEVKYPEVDASAAAEERRACRVVSGHGEEPLARAAVGEGGGGDEGGGLAGEGVRPEGGGGIWSGVRARTSRSRGRVRSVGGCRRGSQGSGVPRAAKKALSTKTCRLAVWDRDWPVTSASRSSRVARVAPGWGRMPWNGSGGGEGSRRTVRVAEVMEGEERTVARET